MSEDIRVPEGLTTEGLLAKRYMARFIDSILLVSVFFMISFGLGMLLAPVRTVSQPLLIFCVALPIWIAYGAILESSGWQATIGKKITGIRVYDANGDRLSAPQAVGRNLVKEGPFLLFGLLPSGNLIALGWLVAHLIVLHNSPVYQAIHDRVARTWVAAPEATTQLHLT